MLPRLGRVYDHGSVSDPSAAVRGATTAPARIIVAAIAVLGLTQGPVYRLWTEAPAEWDAFAAPGAIVSTFMVLYLPGAIGLGRSVQTPTTKFFRRYALLIGFCTWMLISTLWSVAPAVTATNTIGLAGPAVLAVWIRRRFSATEAATAVFLAMSTGVLLSAWAIWRDWSSSVDVDGHWAGIYYNRNSLAPVAAVALLSGAYVAIALLRRPHRISGRVRVIPAMAGVATVGAVALRLLFGSRSLTSWAALAAAASIAGVTFVARRRGWSVRALGTWLGALAVSGLVVLYGFTDRISRWAGRGSDLTGRGEIWKYARQGIKERPVLGWGFMAAWRDPAFRERMNWNYLMERVFEAHNGFLEVWLGAGPIGIALLAVLVIVGLVVCVRNLVTTPGESSWWLAVAGFCLVANLFESFVIGHHFMWLLLIASLVGGSTAGGSAEHHATHPG